MPGSIRESTRSGIRPTLKESSTDVFSGDDSTKSENDVIFEDEDYE